MVRILLVEDDAVTSMILSRAFENAGHAVEVASNGLAAIELLETGDFDVLVTDLMMPRMSGVELCEMVRADSRFDGLPILVTTGVMDSSRTRRLEGFPGIEILHKPVKLASILDRVSSARASL